MQHVKKLKLRQLRHFPGLQTTQTTPDAECLLRPFFRGSCPSSCPQITPPQKCGRVTLITAKTINQRGRDTRPIQIQYPLL
jgi:hypothetical protein